MSSVKSVRYGKIEMVLGVIGGVTGLICALWIVYHLVFEASKRREKEKTECLCVCDSGVE